MLCYLCGTNLQNKSMVDDRSETVALQEAEYCNRVSKYWQGLTAGKSLYWQVPRLPDGLKPGFQHLSWQTLTKQPRSHLVEVGIAWYFILIYRNTGGMWPFRFHSEPCRKEVEKWNNSHYDMPFFSASRKHVFDVWNWEHEIFKIFIS